MGDPIYLLCTQDKVNGKHYDAIVKSENNAPHVIAVTGQGDGLYQALTIAQSSDYAFLVEHSHELIKKADRLRYSLANYLESNRALYLPLLDLANSSEHYDITAIVKLVDNILACTKSSNKTLVDLPLPVLFKIANSLSVSEKANFLQANRQLAALGKQLFDINKRDFDDLLLDNEGLCCIIQI